jgi:hypothetical protein
MVKFKPEIMGCINACGMFCGFAMFYDVFEEGFDA